MRLLTAGLLGLLLGSALPARGQTVATAPQYGYTLYGVYDPYSWNVYREGPGFKFGRDGLVFHPGASVHLGYDSNVLLSNDAVGGGVLMLRAHIDLATLPPQRLDATSKPKLEFRLGAAFEYRQYFASNEAVGTARQYNGFLNFDLAIRPHDPLSLRVYNNLLFTNDARNLEFVTNQFAPRVYERFGLLGTYRPGNGPLEIGLGDAVRLDFYLDNPDLRQINTGRSVANDANLYAQWAFLPQSSLKLEVRSTYINYFDNAAGLPASAPIRVTLGVNSLIVPALGITAYAGYGNSIPIGPERFTLLGEPAYNNFLAGAELRLRLAAPMRLALGWARDFADSIFATYVADDRVYLNYDHNLYRGLNAHIRFDTYFRKYGALVEPAKLGLSSYNNGKGVCTATGPCDRNDIILNLTAELTYRPASFVELGVSYSLLNDITDFRQDDRPVGFLKHLVLAKVDFAY